VKTDRDYGGMWLGSGGQNAAEIGGRGFKT